MNRFFLLVTSSLLCAVAACPTAREAGSFGLPCTNSDSCDDGQLCRESPDDGTLRCLPPHSANEPGESCASPQLAASTGDAGVYVDQLLRFAGVADDEALACSGGARPDRVIRFDVPALDVDVDGKATERPGIEAFADDPSVSLSLRRVDDSGCVELERFGCAAPGEPLLQQRLEPGAYVLVVERDAVAVEARAEKPVRIVVRHLDCPIGALPFDDERCLRATTLQPLLSARAEHSMQRLPDGSVLAIAGEGGPATYEVLSPALQRWRYGTLEFEHRGAASMVLRNNDVLVYAGSAGAQTRGRRLPFSSGDATANLPRSFTIASTGFEDNVTYFGVGLGTGFALFNDDDTALGAIMRRDANPAPCTSTGRCEDGETCMATVTSTGTRNLCICTVDEVCGYKDFTAHALYPGALERNGIAVLGDRFLVLASNDGLETNGRRSVAFVDTARDVPVIEEILAVVQRRGGALLAVDDSRVLIVGGTTPGEDRVAVDDVEVFDLAQRTVVPTSWTLPVAVASPMVLSLAGKLVVVPENDSDEVYVIDVDTGARTRSPLVLPRHDSAAIADGDSVIITGGIVGGERSDAVERLELVARTAPPAEPLACIATPVTGSGPIGGNTSSTDDTFRSTRCEPAAPLGRDNVFSFHIDTPSSVRVVEFEADITVSQSLHRMYLLRGTCNDYEEVACGDADAPISLFAGELPPGDYLLVVESGASFGSSDFQLISGPWQAQLLIGAPLSCPGDIGDPGDETIAGARWLGPSTDSPFIVAGVLCPSDVDNLLFESFGTRSTDLNVFGTAPENLTIRRAIVDVAASVAAGHPVASGTTGPALSVLEDGAPGFYIATLAAPDDAVDFSAYELNIGPGCIADADDSLLPELDNNTLARGIEVLPSQLQRRSSCVLSDEDLLILTPEPGLPSLLTIATDPERLRVQFFAIDGDALGAVLPYAITADPDFVSNTIVDLGVLTGPIAMRLGLVDDGRFFEGDTISVELKQLQEGDTCDNAFELVVDGARSGTVTGDASLFNDNVNAGLVGDCTGYRTPGLDVFFSVELAAGETIELTGQITGDADDIALFILDSCTLDETACVAGIDFNGGGVADELTFTNTGATQVFYVVVDSFEGSPFSYELDWSISGP